MSVRAAVVKLARNVNAKILLSLESRELSPDNRRALADYLIGQLDLRSVRSAKDRRFVQRVNDGFIYTHELERLRKIFGRAA